MKKKFRLIASICMFVLIFPRIGKATDISQEYVDVMNTPYGEVNVVRSADGEGDVVTVNGKKIFQKCCSIGIYGKSQLQDGISVLIGVNPGGSATPENEDFYIVLKSHSDPVVVPGPGFHTHLHCKKGRHVEIVDGEERCS
jgi:hypothetical protein